MAGNSSATWGTPVRAFSGGTSEAFAAKLASDGSLTWNSFLGSSGATDIAYGVAVDGSGNVYVAGNSGATWGTPVRAHSGDTDGFAAKLTGSGTLTWNTFLGTAGTDAANGVAVDGSGNVYISGLSSATWGTPVRSFGGGANDAYAAKLNSSGGLTWNTFLGGAGGDWGGGIALDDSGTVYVGGYSDTTWGSPWSAYTASTDVFAAAIENNGILVSHGFLGGAGSEIFSPVAVAGSNVYLAGQSSATWGSPVAAFGGGSNDVFAIKIAADVNDPPVHTVPGAQSTPQDTPLVFSDSNGNAISVTDPDASTVEVTLTATNGKVSVNLDGSVGPEKLVNTTSTDVQELPALALAADGSYVVAWASQNEDSEGYGVYAQRYEANGNAVGDEIQVHTYEAGDQTNPSIAIDDSGNFVVAWQTKHLGSGYFNIYARRFAADGTALDANEFRVDAVAGGDVINAAAAMDADGDFVIAFENHVNHDGDGWGIYARRYDNTGASQGGFKVNTTIAGNQAAPSVAMDDAGNFVVAWDGPVGADHRVLFQRYDNTGAAQGGETTVTANGYMASVSADATGNFVVAWQGQDVLLSWGVFARQFNSTGTAWGPSSRSTATRPAINWVPMWR